jgi:hypothetical protein
MANISAFQANDRSSILRTRTNRTVPARLGLFYWYEIGDWILNCDQRV